MPKILVVDDASFVRMQYRKSLVENGYEVEEAANGVDALEKYRETNPDGVLLDINMPVMDGIVTLHEIMHLDPSAKVAMVTCIGSQSIILTALKTGARDFVVKPTGKDGLIDTVEKLLA
jgi:two-component system, chemotaxis family, chemotaxis protein CheY